MDFPKRIKQHKSQSDSFAILLYKLKDLGISEEPLKMTMELILK